MHVRGIHAGQERCSAKYPDRSGRPGRSDRRSGRALDRKEPGPNGHRTDRAITPERKLLRLTTAVRWLAFDRTLPASEALGRIRDAFQDYDHSSKS